METLAFRPGEETPRHLPRYVSQAVFLCTACGYACHADVNAARNIAAGHAVTARGGFRDTGPVNREPQLLASLTGRQ
ncbi:MAG TPA: zinc ribbon domain-containing protein [Streptosporangiaceae bacterium]